MLGAEGQGFVNFMKTLDNGRIGIAALSLGIAEGAFEQALQYTSARRQFGQPIATFQGVQFQLSDLATEIEAGKHMTFHAAWLAQTGRPLAESVGSAISMWRSSSKDPRRPSPKQGISRATISAARW